jgi:hypothetical protein
VALVGIALTGLFPAAYFHDEPPWNWLGIALLAGLDPVCTFLIVRSCGYRLVRTTRTLPTSNDIPPNGAPSPHIDLP